MKRADEAARRLVIAHGVGTSVVTTSTRTKSGVKSFRETGWFSGNATANGSQRSSIREKLELRLGSQTKVTTIEYVTQNRLVAERHTGSTRWLCGPVTELDTIPAWTPDSFQFMLPGSPAKSWVGGSARFHGTGVWKVNYSFRTSNRPAFSNERGTFLVDKRLFVIRHVSVTTDSGQGSSRSHETSSATLTGFGKVKLPGFPSCR
jgi:hypothetical protein